MIITIYTDGSCRNNPGPGGYAAILSYQEHSKQISGAFRLTTNNRMELLSIIKALECLKVKKCDIQIYSDSLYVINAINKGWLHAWVKNNFKGKANSDLWKKYLDISKDFNIQLIWVKGHADTEGNNMCDKLATTASDIKNKNNWLIDEFYENLK